MAAWASNEIRFTRFLVTAISNAYQNRFLHIYT